MANATNIYVADWRDGNVYHAWTALSGSSWNAVAGYGWNGQNWVTGIRFRVAAPASSVSFGWYTMSARGGYGDLKYRVTEGEDSSLINATASTAGTAFSANLQEYGSNSLTVAGSFKPGVDYVLYLWTARSTSYSCFVSIRVVSSTYPLTVTYTAAASYGLGLSVDTGITAAVSINSSPYGRSGTLANGSTVYAGEQIRVTYSAQTGYAISSATINGVAIASGAVHTVSGSVSVVLSAAYAVSTISTGNGTFGAAQTITVTRYSTAYVHTITATCAGRTQTVATGSAATTISWTPDPSIMEAITTAMSASCTLTCVTLSGSTEIGRSSTTITLSLPTSGAYSVTPTPSVSVSDTTGYAETYGGYVLGRSRFHVTVTDGLKCGATVATRTTSANGGSYSEAAFDTNVIASTGYTTITVTVKDSRGQTATASATVTILDYAMPAITALSVHRCDSTGAADEAGEYFYIDYSAAISALNDHNGRALTLRYRAAQTSSWRVVEIPMDAYTQSGSSEPQQVTTTYTYQVQLVATDDFSAVTAATSLSTVPVTFNANVGGQGAAFGKYAETDGLLDVAWNLLVRGSYKLTEIFDCSAAFDATSDYCMGLHYIGDNSDGAPFTGNGLLVSIRFGSSKLWGAQMALGDSGLYYRAKRSGTWQAWVTIAS